MIAGLLGPAIALAAVTTQTAFTCQLAHPEGQLYKMVDVEALVNVQTGKVQYAVLETDHDGKNLVSEKSASLYSIGNPQIRLKIEKNGATVIVPADVLTSVKPVVGNYKKVDSAEALNCWRASIGLQKTAAPEFYDQFKFPNENKDEVGKSEVFRSKNWLSSDASMSFSMTYVPKSGPNCHHYCGPAFSTLRISFLGAVTGQFGENETNIDYLFYNPNALPQFYRSAQTKLTKAEDVQAVRAILSEISQNGVAVLPMEGVHSSEVTFTVDCSTQECFIKAKN